MPFDNRLRVLVRVGLRWRRGFEPQRHRVRHLKCIIHSEMQPPSVTSACRPQPKGDPPPLPRPCCSLRITQPRAPPPDAVDLLDGTRASLVLSACPELSQPDKSACTDRVENLTSRGMACMLPPLEPPAPATSLRSCSTVGLGTSASVYITLWGWRAVERRGSTMRRSNDTGKQPWSVNFWHAHALGRDERLTPAPRLPTACPAPRTQTYPPVDAGDTALDTARLICHQHRAQLRRR